MKAFLITDMPKCCNECKCNFDHWCSFDNFERHINDLERKPKWCPLRPLPEKQKLTVTGKNQIKKKKIIKSKSLEWIKKGYIDNPEVAFYCGYNAYRSEIAGETE